MRKFFLFTILFSCIFQIHCVQNNSSFVIDKNTCIIISENPEDAVTLASVELQYFIKKRTNIDIPILTELPDKKSKPIFVGSSKHTKDINAFGDQEYLIDVSPDQIILIGKDNDNRSKVWQDEGRDSNGISPKKDRIQIDYSLVNGKDTQVQKLVLPSIYDPQGTCYAVYDFIERCLGILFYGPHPNNVVIPSVSKVSIQEMKIQRSPSLMYRHGTYTLAWPMMKEQYFDPSYEMQQLFLRRIRFGGLKWSGNHAFSSYQDRFLKKNPDNPELFESYHPEYFAHGRTGGAGERQFCYTNEGFIKQVAKDAIEYFNDKGLKGNQIAAGDYFSVIPLDNAAWCKCDECQRQIAIDKDNITGSHFSSGLATHYLWTFVNNVAKEVRKTNSTGKISALAYHVYAFKPNFQLEENIAVAPCLQNRNYWVPKVKENDIRFYKEWIEESKKSGRDVFLWNYLCFPTERGVITNFNVFPGFNIHEVGNNIKMYAEDGVKGTFLCGIGEQLDFYIVMKLYDNPNLNIDELTDEFFTSYFGKAALPMKKFYLKIEETYSNPKNYPVEIQTKDDQYHQTEEIAWKYLGTDDVMTELEKYIEEAEKSDINSLEMERVLSWKTGVWEYMKKGKSNYAIKVASK